MWVQPYHRRFGLSLAALRYPAGRVLYARFKSQEPPTRHGIRTPPLDPLEMSDQVHPEVSARRRPIDMATLLIHGNRTVFVVVRLHESQSPPAEKEPPIRGKRDEQGGLSDRA